MKRIMAVGVVAASVLSACAGPSTIGPPRREAATWSEMIYASSQGPMLVDVRGQPFGGNIAPKVAAMMSGQVPQHPFDFTTDPTRAPHPDKRVVVAFNPAPSVSEYDLCANRDSALADGGAGHIAVRAAFCDHAQPLSATRGWVDNVSGPDDPRLAALLGEVTRQLFGDDTETRMGHGTSGAIR
jgi:hypothetical protein